MAMNVAAALRVAICGIVVLTLAVPAAADTAALYEAAKKEGELTWYTAHTEGETAEAVGRAFSEKYPGVKVNVIRTTAQVAYQRLRQEIRSSSAQCDVFSSTDVGHDVALKTEGRFAHYVPENADKVGPEFRGFDPDGYFYPTVGTLVAITYNTEKVRPEEAPRRWTDLLDPKWKGKVSVGHPGFSGTVGTWAVLMRKLHGWDYFEKLERNKPQISRSISDTVTMLASGERAVAAGIASPTLKSADRGNAVAVSYPEDGTLLIVSPSAVMANAPHPNAARLFLEFLLSVEHAEVMARNYRQPVRPEVRLLKGAKALAEIKVLRPSVDEIVKGIPEVIEQWRDTFGS